MGSQVYPDDPRPAYVFTGSQSFSTGIVEIGSTEQRRIKQLYPKHNFTLLYDKLSNSELETFWEFYRRRWGPGDSFWYFDHRGRFYETNWYFEFIAVADGILSIFDIPGILGVTDTITVFQNSVPLVRDTDYQVLIGGGSGNADRIEFLIAPPVAGAQLACDFEGRIRVMSRFTDDEMTFEWFAASLFNSGLELTGLLPNTIT